jgi:hypothetical protein
VLCRRKVAERAAGPPMTGRACRAHVPDLDRHAQVGTSIIQRDRHRQAVAQMDLVINVQPNSAVAQVNDYGVEVTPGAACPATSPVGGQTHGDAWLMPTFVDRPTGLLGAVCHLVRWASEDKNRPAAPRALERSGRFAERAQALE